MLSRASLLLVSVLSGAALANEGGRWLVDQRAVARQAFEDASKLASPTHRQTFEAMARYAHIDEPDVADNFVAAQEAVRRMVDELGAAIEIRELEFTRFASSFIRIAFELRFDDASRRLMFTYRKKSRGWRVNQIIVSELGQ